MATGIATENDYKYLNAVITHPDPAVTAVEIAEILEVSQQAAHKKLSELQERKMMKSKRTGSRSRVWWITTTGREAYAGFES